MKNAGELKYVGEVRDLFDIAGLVGGGALGLFIGGFGAKRIVRLIAKAELANEPNQSPGANSEQKQERKVVNSSSVSSRARIRSNRTKGK